MKLQHHGFNGKLFDSLFFVVWLICMYRNGLLHQRETSTHKAAKSVGPHVYFQVGSLECVPNGYMDYSCISLQSPTLAVVVVFFVDKGKHKRIWNDMTRRPCPGGKEGYYYYYYCTIQHYYYISIMLQVKIKFRFNIFMLGWFWISLVS